MINATITERLTKMLVEKLGIDIARVVPEANLVDDLGIDSLDTMELLMTTEDEFGIEISEADGEKIKTVGDAVAYFERRNDIT